MSIQKDQKSKSKDIIKKFINGIVRETNDELRNQLNELKKIKKEIANSSSK